VKKRLPYEKRIPLFALFSAMPAIAVALILIWTGDFAPRLRWTLSLAVVGGWFGFWLVLREHLIRPLQTVSNMIAALQEGDYSMRVRLGSPDDSLGLVAYEVNTLGTTLRDQRLEVLETTALLRRVMMEIDVAVFAFDVGDRLVLANRVGERLLGRSEESMRGRLARSIGLGDLLANEAPRVEDIAFPGGASRWEVRISHFRQEGKPHRLLVLSDLSRVLREEERKAWQRLVRVLSHEINNSLAPIRSIAQSLLASASSGPRDAGPGQAAATVSAGEGATGAVSSGERAAAGVDADDDLRQGLEVIAGRSEALARFMSSYAKLARLPPPELAPLDVSEWVRRVAGLETRMPVEVRPGPEVELRADGDQLDQLLINLVDNAVDAASETGGGVRVGWDISRSGVEVWVEDDGPGIPDTGTLFVPFYTTKPNGSGIGLLLSREIAEAHRGSLRLENRVPEGGCVARFTLPATSIVRR
jgi:two-component system nitrogen regulation sensor histidine kinase NtrY